MTPQERQAALDNISEEDLAKIKQVTEKAFKIEPEDLALVELAARFGYEAYLDAKNDVMSSKEMAMLITGSRKLAMRDMYYSAQAAFIGAGSAQSKKPSQTFTALTSKLLKEMEADS